MGLMDSIVRIAERLHERETCLRHRKTVSALRLL